MCPFSANPVASGRALKMVFLWSSHSRIFPMFVFTATSMHWVQSDTAWPGHSWTNYRTLPETHHTNIKELAATNINCCITSCHLSLGKKVTLEHTANTTAKGQFACIFCAYVRGNNLYQTIIKAPFNNCFHTTFAYHRQFRNIAISNRELVW